MRREQENALLVIVSKLAAAIWFLLPEEKRGLLEKDLETFEKEWVENAARPEPTRDDSRPSLTQGLE